MEKKEAFAQAITDILVRRHVIDQDGGRAILRAFKNSQKENFDFFLMQEGLVPESHLIEALSEHYQVPGVDVTGYFFDTQLLRNFPKDFLLRNRIIPLEMEDDELIIVASEPDNPDLLSMIGAYSSEDIQFQVGLGPDICDAIEEYYDKSDTDLLDDQDLIDEQVEEEERYHELLHSEDEDVVPTIKQEIDADEE